VSGPKLVTAAGKITTAHSPQGGWRGRRPNTFRGEGTARAWSGRRVPITDALPGLEKVLAARGGRAEGRGLLIMGAGRAAVAPRRGGFALPRRSPEENEDVDGAVTLPRDSGQNRYYLKGMKGPAEGKSQEVNEPAES